MTWHRAFAERPRRLAKGDEEPPDHPDYLPTSLIAPRVGHMLRAISQHPNVSSSAQDLAHAILKNGDHHSLPILADALEESDNGDPSHPTHWINWRNAGHGIELDKRVFSTLLGRGGGARGVRFESPESQAGHDARFNRPIFYVTDRLSGIHPNDITPEMRRQLFPAVSQSLARIGQHAVDAETWRMVEDGSLREHRAALKNSLLNHGDLSLDHWSTVPPEKQLAETKSAVRYEEPADIKFPGE